MAKVFAAVFNPKCPWSFEELLLVTSNCLEMADKMCDKDAVAKIAFFPEYWIHRSDKEFFRSPETGDHLDLIFRGRKPVPLESEEMESMREIAEDNNSYISSGWLELAPNANYLSSVLINPDGKILCHHRKQNPMGIEVEGWDIKRGRTLNVYTGKDFSLGWIICNDINDPRLAEKLFEKRVDIVHHPKGFDFAEPRFGDAAKSWEEVERVRAKDMMAYLVSDTNSTGRPGEDAAAQIVDCYGLQKSSLHTEGMMACLVDTYEIAEYRKDPLGKSSRCSVPRII